MKISVLITTYNAEKFIVETLDSILAQTFCDYEIIIVDDGSHDKTKVILHQYQNKHTDTKIKIYELEHIGRAGALAYAVKHSNYDWVAIVDADDLWHQQKLFIQAEYIKRFNLSFLATQASLFEKSSEIDLHHSVNLKVNYDHLRQLSLDQMLLKNSISHSSVVFKKDLARYDESRKRQIDYELWLRLLIAGEKLFVLRTDLAYHRLHDHQSFEARGRLKYVWGCLQLQMKYSLKTLKLLQFILCFAKIFYYLFATKRIKKALNSYKFSNSKSDGKY